MLDRIGSSATVRSTGGRYFGFVTGNSEPIASAAAVLALAWDQNIAVPVMSPIASRLDAIAAGWICQLLGLPDSSTASFCGGASIANLTCIITARDAMLSRAGWDVNEKGLFGAPEISIVRLPQLRTKSNISDTSLTNQRYLVTILLLNGEARR